MKIQEIDKNFAVNNVAVEDGIRYYSIPHPDFDLYGVFYDAENNGFFRMPKAVAETVSPGVAWGAGCTSGGRLRFSTDSKTFVLKATYPCLPVMLHMSVVGQAGFMLVEETGGKTRLVKMMTPQISEQTGFSATTELTEETDGKMRSYILYFPLFNELTSVEIGLDENAKVGKGRAYRDMLPILYYGSSITHGGCASRADNTYQAFISRWNDIDFINLGFSGNAKGEDEMVDHLACVDCSLFVCDYDHNAPDVEHLQKTHYRLYERYRAVRKETPILFVSKPDCLTEVDREREKIIRETCKKAKARGDENVYFLAGKSFFRSDRENCMVDGCHPNDLGFYRMAKKIYKKMIEIGEKFR